MTPAPPQRHVLRLDLVHDDDDDDGDDQRHVLVAVWPTKDAENILDMEFLATDDTKAYVTTRMFHSHFPSPIHPVPQLCMTLYGVPFHLPVASGIGLHRAGFHADLQ